MLALALGLFCLVALLAAVPLYGGAADLDGFTRIAAVQNTLLIGISWLLIPFLGSLRAHRAILVGFSAGAATMAGFGWLLADPDAGMLLSVLNASFALTDALMMAFWCAELGLWSRSTGAAAAPTSDLGAPGRRAGLCARDLGRQSHHVVRLALA